MTISMIIEGSLILRSFDPDRSVDVYQELVKTKNVAYQWAQAEIGKPCALMVPRLVMEQILVWNNTQEYAELPLHEFLDKINAGSEDLSAPALPDQL